MTEDGGSMDLRNVNILPEYFECDPSQYVMNGSGAHPASYPMGTRGSFLGVKRPGSEADHSPSSAKVKE